MEFVTLYTTWPNAESAERCAFGLVEARLAACCTCLPGAVSIYRWEGAIHRDAEIVMLVKTAQDKAVAARDFILAAHPYDTPCVTAWTIGEDASAPAYLAWVAAETRLEGEK